MTECRRKVTYFAIDPFDPNQQEIVLGRGDPDSGDSLAHVAFASVDTTDPALHGEIVSHLTTAAEGQTITRANAAEVLSRSLHLAEASLSQRASRS